MTKLLVVKGHPLTAEDSFSIKGLDTFVSAYKTANADDEVEVLDVFSADIPEIDQDMASAFIAMQNGVDFTALSESQQDKIARFGAFTEQFLSADKVVIASPLWNLMIPASLKNGLIQSMLLVKLSVTQQKDQKVWQQIRKLCTCKQAVVCTMVKIQVANT